MVGYDPKEKKLPQYAYGVAGAASGFITRAISQPLDVLKIRLQVYLVHLTLLLSFDCSVLPGVLASQVAALDLVDTSMKKLGPFLNMFSADSVL